jgi:hypothetical protein
MVSVIQTFFTLELTLSMSSIFEFPKKLFCMGSGVFALSATLVFGSATAQTSAPALTAPPKQIPAIEKGALDIIKQMSTKLSSAKTLQFQARVQSDAPSIDGIPVIYTSNSDFAIQRPNKMAVMTSGQGLPSELIYDGKSIVAITPNTEIVAFSKAPGNIDDMAQYIFKKAGLYFPGGMILLSDPYANLTGDMRAAFIVEKTKLVGGVETDVVVLAGSGMEGQFWIGSQDKLPYMISMIYTKEPNRPRVTIDFSHWKVNAKIDSERFNTAKIANAIKVDFAHQTAPLK